MKQNYTHTQTEHKFKAGVKVISYYYYHHYHHHRFHVKHFPRLLEVLLHKGLRAG